MKKINFITFFMLTLTFFGNVHNYMCFIFCQDKEISRKLIKKLFLVFNFMGNTTQKKFIQELFSQNVLKY